MAPMMAISGLRSRLSGPTGMVVIANLAAQLLTMAAMFAATYIYSPSAYGVFQLVFSGVLIVVPFLTGASEITISVAKSTVAAQEIVRRTIRNCAVCLAGGTAAALVAALTSHRELAEVVAWTAAVVPIMAVNAIETGWLARAGASGFLAARAVVPALVMVLGQLGAPLLVGPSATVLCLAFLVSRASGLLWGRRHLRATTPSGRAPHEPVSEPSRGQWPLALLLSNLALQLPVLGAGISSGPAASAALGLAVRVAGLPASLLGPGFQQAVTLRLGRSRECLAGASLGLKVLQRQLLGLSVGMGVTGAVAALAIGPWTVPSAYRSSMTYLGILAVPYCLQLVGRAMMPVFPVLGWLPKLLALQAARLFAVCGVVAAAWGLGLAGSTYVAAVGGVSGIAFVLLYVLVVRLLDSQHESGIRPESDSIVGVQ